jgi:hypothetical protein
MYVYYNRTDELGDLFQTYCKKNHTYINAYKLLYKYQEKYRTHESFKTLEVFF